MMRSNLFQHTAATTLLAFLAACSTTPVASTPSAVAPLAAATASAAAPSTTTVAPTAAPATAPVPAGQIEFKNEKQYRVEYSAIVRNSGFHVTRLEFSQPMPVNWDGQQNVRIEEVTPANFESERDSAHGNGIYYWEMNAVPKPGESQKFTIRFTFDALEIVTQVDAEKVPAYNSAEPLYKLYTRPERFIESDEARIVELANTIAAGETNPYILARKFYDHVIDTAHYKLLGQGLRGASALLTGGEGECGDFAALFVALSRAKGIPARPVVGYWAISGLEQTHVWAEFYIEGLGWVPVDPTIGQQSRSDRMYYFGNMDNQRVILSKGFNISLPNDNTADLMQVPSWWFWGEGDSGLMSMDRTGWKVEVVP